MDMADINIERKRKSPLPWIIGLLALAVLALLLMRACGDDEEEVDMVVTDSTTAVTPAAGPIDTMPVAAPTDSASVTTP
jgi:hypothetical protein